MRVTTDHGIELKTDAYEGGADIIYQALESAPAAARVEARREAHDILGSEELEGRVRELVDYRFRHKYRPHIILTVGAMAIFFFAIFYYVQSAQTVTAAALASQNSALVRNEAEIAAFRTQLETSNVKLVSQGLPPVIAPTNPVPGSPEQATLSNAAATASTLASLPPAALRQPTAEALGQAVADYVSVNPAALSTPLIQSLAAYFASTATITPVAPVAPVVVPAPLPTGNIPPAATVVVPAPVPAPPTAEEITKAFAQAVRDNPQLLCPAGGSYQSQSLALSDGSSIMNYGCFGVMSPPPPPQPAPKTTTDNPAPTTTDSPALTTTNNPAPTTAPPVPKKAVSVG